MNNKTQKLVNNYINGNLETAAKTIRGLSKLQLAILYNTHRFELELNSDEFVRFHSFIMRSLETKG